MKAITPIADLFPAFGTERVYITTWPNHFKNFAPFFCIIGEARVLVAKVQRHYR